MHKLRIPLHSIAFVLWLQTVHVIGICTFADSKSYIFYHPEAEFMNVQFR
jgi:hypothetical protein